MGSDITSAAWDPGLQNERTRLAWVRLGAALCTLGLVAAGVTVRHGMGGVPLAAFAFGALCGAMLLARVGVRFERLQRALHLGHPLDFMTDALIAWSGVMAVVAGAVIFVVSA
ncbi:DUF202 domain-containing protein [Microtetraspora sp. AC03309]|uniref:DUF202 domain-containing protein n=1 Tax=Microtetraspora sp. AC03309 TaxID=2779376 RepID=UPI001E59DE16|nr:DUF202 domain-containing protein [Microtetraspora sp. AC03309]MCC5576994.1 DUF202 domain-containing protein [Microtetraspora sp. AC03309]